MFAFEVKNLISSAPGHLCRIASTIPSARIVRQPKWLSLFREEVFYEIELDGITFVAWEPFGDKRCLLDWPRTNTLGTARSIAFVKHSVGHDGRTYSFSGCGVRTVEGHRSAPRFGPK